VPSPILPPLGPDLRQWGRQLSSYLQRNLAKLGQKTADDNPSEDGVILWDRTNKYPVVSKDGAFVQVVLEDGHASFYRNSDVIIDTGAGQAINTAYAITYDAPTGNVSIDRDATDNSKIVFEEAGEYVVMFSAQISSTSSSTVKFYFWPRLNGTDAPNNTIIYSLHQNDATVVVSRSAKFDVSAGDYLQVMWAVDNTSGFLDASGATSFSPAAPATTLHITRMHG
jgi:hypothetical protein